MKPRLHPLYKKLLLLAIVIGPFYWLVLTEDGQWRTDTVLLSLLGKTNLNLAPERLYPELTVATLRERFADLDLACSPVVTPFGDQLCTAKIGTFNAIPSRAVAFFYAGEQLAAVKIDYRRSYHERMLRWLEARLGPAQALSAEADGAPVPERTLSWPVERGVVIARAEVPGRDETPALLWLSSPAIAGGSD